VKLGFMVLEHPAHSPDLAPFDCHLFGPLKDAFTLILLTWRIWWASNNSSRWQIGFNSAFKGLRDRRFTSDKGLNEAVHEWLAARPKAFFSGGIQKLLESWNKCIAKHLDYIEKWYNCKVSAVVEINYKNCVRIFLTCLSTFINLPTRCRLLVSFKFRPLYLWGKISSFFFRSGGLMDSGASLYGLRRFYCL
jgi:hypothetical protein